MEEPEYLDKLRQLKYVQRFCRPRKLNPFHPLFFAVTSSNPNEQFYTLACLVTWLLSLAGKGGVSEPGQFDDPNLTTNTMVDVVKAAGVAWDAPPAKFKQAWGSEVCGLLSKLGDLALLAQGGGSMSITSPVHQANEYDDEAEVDGEAEVKPGDGVGDDEIHEEHMSDSDDEEDEEEVVLIKRPTTGSQSASGTMTRSGTSAGLTRVGTANPSRIGTARPNTGFTEVNLANMSMSMAILPADWQIELERVTPMLKVTLTASTGNTKDWRVHLQQMTALQEAMQAGVKQETSSLLGRLRAEIDDSLEKIRSREKYINSQFTDKSGEFKTLQDNLANLVQSQNAVQEKINGHSNTLAGISAELETVKAQMDSIGSGMTDSSPLQTIKTSFGTLKGDVRQLDLRIGVIQHTLAFAKMKGKFTFGDMTGGSRGDMFGGWGSQLM